MRAFDAMDGRVVTALRVLAVDQVEQARSGHPGMPLGAAPMAYALWSRFLRHDPSAPDWPGRDRFVLSAGHGSALLYGLLHLFGYDVPIDELRRFRQWGSRTPGHPEYGHTPGVETTTGPLGQGLANATGMALAERMLAARFGSEAADVVGHRTWVIVSDGDLMEGISHEAASLAGHLRLGRLVALHDDNRITIDGPSSLATSEDVGARFAAYGWRVFRVEDGNDLVAIGEALERAASSEDAPALVQVRTHIGFGSPHKQDTSESHGAPLGTEEAAATRRALGWELAEPFAVPAEILDHARRQAEAGREERKRWSAALERFRIANPDLAAELERRWRGEPPPLPTALAEFGAVRNAATREASGAVLNAVAAHVPELAGGSADLAGSNSSTLKGVASIAPGDYAGRNLHFGVREHAMAAIANGIALHRGFRPYVATFLIFSDYLKPALRLSALMRLPVIYLFTHDSVAVGEDGPTHQPIEQLAALRSIPGLTVVRPADAWETEQAWRFALEHTGGPTALVLSRQKLPVLDRPTPGALARGAYVRAEASSGVPEAVLFASGSEVALALAARDLLEASGVPTRVVSAPSLELFAAQDRSYRDGVTGPSDALRVAVEMAHPQGWHGVVGAQGVAVGIERFGASAPGDEVAARLGFTPQAIVERVRSAVAERQPTQIASAVPRKVEGAVAGRRARLESLHAESRLAARDASLWGERHARDVARRLGWLDAPARTLGELPALRRLVAALAGDGARTLFLLGMGGSSLAPHVLRSVGGNPSGRDLVVLDTTDPERVSEALAAVSPEETAVLAVSKSGTTAETSALLEILWERQRNALGERATGRFVVLTEPATPLATLAVERRYRATVPHPVDVGGRFSALTSVGVLPALWLGLDAEALLDGGRRALESMGARHPAVDLATVLAGVSPTGWSRLAIAASPDLHPLGAWAEQLIAESTGKDGKGVLPVLVRPGTALSLWPDTLFLSPRFADEDTEALDAALDRLTARDCPVLRWRLRRDQLGEAFAVLELATALAGLLLGVNPFDEPDVVRAKERARAALSEGRHERPATPSEPAAALLDHLRDIGAGDAIALLAYLPENPRVGASLDRLGEALAARLGAPVTTAFGPRYLHSTGQLHKGGPTHIVPIVLTCDAATDVTIPGRRFSLGALRYAQAIGDLAALREVGRKALHLHLGTESESVLAAILRSLG